MIARLAILAKQEIVRAQVGASVDLLSLLNAAFRLQNG
jgi:hypothetical protein